MSLGVLHGVIACTQAATHRYTRLMVHSRDAGLRRLRVLGRSAHGGLAQRCSRAATGDSNDVQFMTRDTRSCTTQVTAPPWSHPERAAVNMTVRTFTQPG
jgi:hypothetical protein